MTPKLLINFIVDAKITPAKDLQSLLDTMKQAKVFYIQVLLKNIETIEQLREYSQLFKKFRSAKYVDYTIWVDDGSTAQVKPDVVEMVRDIRGMLHVEPTKEFKNVKKNAGTTIAAYIDTLVRGIATKQEDLEYKEFETWHYHGIEALPTFTQLMEYSEEQIMTYNFDALKIMKAPGGMKRGFERVLNDYKTVPRLSQD